MDRHRAHTTLAFVTVFTSVQNSVRLSPVLGILISIFPVLHGCESLPCPDSCFTETQTASVKLAVQKPEYDRIGHIDALVFNDDRLQRLDCYQRFDGVGEQVLNIASTSGEKLLMACANSKHTFHDWYEIYSPTGLKGMKIDLEDEIREFPVMCGAVRFITGENVGQAIELEFKRISAEIVLHSLSSDFTGRAYEGEKLQNIKVYLTNINVTSSIWDETGIPERYMNQGRLNNDDVEAFTDPSLIYQEIDGEVGTTSVYPDIRLRCYPNTCADEGPGTAFTRLVIQADIQGETWFWPIDINRLEENGDIGVHRNTIYRYDIIIRRKGSADPDTAVSTGDIDIKVEIKEWKEKEEYAVQF